MELFLSIREESMRKIPQLVDLPEGKTFFVILEGRMPVCFWCDQQEKNPKNCPFYKGRERRESLEETEMEEETTKINEAVAPTPRRKL